MLKITSIIPYLLTCFLIFTQSSYGANSKNISVYKIGHKVSQKEGLISIHYKGDMKGYPELKVVGKSIQIYIPSAKVNKTIEKAISVSSSLKDTQLRAYQTSKNAAKLKVLLPYQIQKRKDQVSITLKDQKIELSFPRVKLNLKKTPSFKKITKTKKKVKKEFLDEKYLNSLLKVENKEKNKKEKITTKKLNKTDEVNVKQAAPEVKLESAGKQFSLLEYGGKFVAFLGLMLLFLYGVMNLMKKGFIKKGKLGFLNDTSVISVLSQKYIAPKKSLMLVKAHNQVFLIGNTEQGLHAISEIRDVTGLLKEGEAQISGHNFDHKLDFANDDNENDSKIKLKDDISKSNQESSLSNYLDVKEKVKFSDQVKKKVKNLKRLQ